MVLSFSIEKLLEKDTHEKKDIESVSEKDSPKMENIYKHDDEKSSPPNTVSSRNSMRKKARTSFTDYQVAALEARYKRQRYIAPTERVHLARSLNLQDQQVKTWFQNRRMKEKRVVTDQIGSYAAALPYPPLSLVTRSPTDFSVDHFTRKPDYSPLLMTSPFSAVFPRDSPPTQTSSPLSYNHPEVFKMTSPPSSASSLSPLSSPSPSGPVTSSPETYNAHLSSQLLSAPHFLSAPAPFSLLPPQSLLSTPPSIVY